MSEFQYYEFVAIDRPLSAAAQSKLRAITSRATITSTQLVNTYEWGDFKGDPHALVAKYFDAFLYYANWGTRRLILRVPTARLDTKVVRQYCPILKSRSRRNSGVATVTIVDAHLSAPVLPTLGGSKRLTGSQRALAEFLRIDSQ